MNLTSMALFLFAILLVVSAGRNHDRYERHREAVKNKDKYPGCCVEPVSLHAHASLPHNFDWCNVDGKSFCAPSWNQHQPKYCGACYIHGTLSALNDRLKIMRNGEGIDILLARQVILNCGQKHGFGNGCHGGESTDIFEFMRQIGLGEEGCYNYLAEEKECPDSGEGYCINCMMFGGDTTDYKCWAVDQYVKYYVKDYGFVTGEEKMKAEIYARGPVTCGLVCPDEFVYGYKGGIFEYKGNETDVDHDVEVVGWGEEDGVPFWKVRNSWGTYWGEDGFFRIVRGKNNLRIEENCAFATLDLHEEREMRTGKLEGSMFGVTRPHVDGWRFKTPDPQDVLKHRPKREEPKDPLPPKHGKHKDEEKPPVAVPESLVATAATEHRSIGLLPLFAFALVALALYVTWRFYSAPRYSSDYTEFQ
jgi:hypothetical protein